MQIYKIALVLIAGLSLLFAFVKYLEIGSVFFPTQAIEFTPAYINLAFEDIYIDTPDGVKINGWFIPCDNAKYTLFFLHGNGGNISHRLDKIGLLNKTGLNIFIIDYRGYGRSPGKPSEAGIYRDAQAGYDYLINRRKISPGNIVAYGESLGTAAAIDLASKVELKALIVEGAFSSGRDMAKRIFPLIPWRAFSDSFNSLRKIKEVTVPKLFLHSLNDEIVPLALSKKLFDRASGLKHFGELAGSHNTAFLDSQDKYLSAIAAFIKQL
jgi:hypothetical protein